MKIHRRNAASLVRPSLFESLEQRIALAIHYAIKPGTTLDIAPISSIIPASPAGMDRMEVLLTTGTGVAHGTLSRVSGVSAYPWGSPAPNPFSPGYPNNLVPGGQGLRYENNGNGNGTSITIPVKFRNSTGTITLTDSIVIALDANLQPPTITTQPQPYTEVGLGGRDTLNVVASGPGTLSYQWYAGFAPSTANPISGATGPQYMTPVLSALQAYNYWVRVTNSAGSVNSNGVTVQTVLATSVITSDYSTSYRSTAQTIPMSATVTPNTATGKVTFGVLSLGASTQSAFIMLGVTGDTPFPVPAGAAVGAYPLQAHFQGPAGWAESFDNKVFTIVKASTSIDTSNYSTLASASTNQFINMSATVTSAAPVQQGDVTFRISNGTNVITFKITPKVTNGIAAADVFIPPNITAGSYTIRAEYNPSTNYLGSTNLTRRLTIAPVITANTTAQNANISSLTINGFGFSTTLADNVITFPAGVTGSVTAATANSITLSNLTGLVAGALNLAVTVRGQASTTVQVATIRPVITLNTVAIPPNAPSLTINGFGFSTTAANNSLVFPPGVTGSITSASKTQLVYTFSAPLANGALSASITSNGVASVGAVQVATVDATGPTASAGQFIRNAPNFGKLSITFSDPISPAILLAKLRVDAVGDEPQTFFPSAVSQDPVTHVAIFSFNTPFSERNYRATVIAAGLVDSLGNQMAANYGFEFFLLAADTNLDRVVNHLDFNILYANFGPAAGKLWSQGDCNGDGKVNFLDFQIMERNFGKSLPPPPVAAPNAASAATKTVRPVLVQKRKIADFATKRINSTL